MHGAVNFPLMLAVVLEEFGLTIDLSSHQPGRSRAMRVSGASLQSRSEYLQICQEMASCFQRWNPDLRGQEGGGIGSYLKAAPGEGVMSNSV
jgi:hypothetical protein